MNIYIVTKSAQYYPMSGSDDWVLVTKDYDEARRLANDLEVAADEVYDDAIVELIKINTDNLQFGIAR